MPVHPSHSRRISKPRLVIEQVDGRADTLWLALKCDNQVRLSSRHYQQTTVDRRMDRPSIGTRFKVRVVHANHDHGRPSQKDRWPATRPSTGGHASLARFLGERTARRLIKPQQRRMRGYLPVLVTARNEVLPQPEYQFA